MTKSRNNILYVCSLIEYTAQKTNNYPADVTRKAGVKTLEHFYALADVYHCQTFEQSSAEFIEYMDGLSAGNRRMSAYESVPSPVSVGLAYTNLIEDVHDAAETVPETIYRVMTSFISDEISNFHSSFYYSGDRYILACYRAGKVLD